MELPLSRALKIVDKIDFEAKIITFCLIEHFLKLKFAGASGFMINI